MQCGTFTCLFCVISVVDSNRLLSTLFSITRNFVSTNLQFAVILLYQQIKPSLLLEQNLFLLFLCIFPLITIVLSVSFTIKRRLFARKEWLTKRNKATLISLCSPGRAISADIGREFRPLRLVWWALQGAQLWKGKRKRESFVWSQKYTRYVPKIPQGRTHSYNPSRVLLYINTNH
jgi:hypothetical protein